MVLTTIDMTISNIIQIPPKLVYWMCSFNFDTLPHFDTLHFANPMVQRIHQKYGKKKEVKLMVNINKINLYCTILTKLLETPKLISYKMNYLIALMLNLPKTKTLPKTLKSNICAFYIWLQVVVIDFHKMSWKLSNNQMVVMKGVFTRMVS